MTTFRLGRRLYRSTRVVGRALDMLLPLLCTVPAAQVSASFGLLYLAAAIYLAF